MPVTRKGMTTDVIEELIAQRMADELATYEANRNTKNGLAQWFEKIGSVFHISNCVVKCQVKYATCTLLNGALTWWNSHVRTVGHDAAYKMSWKDLKKMMTEAYCPRNEIQKLETKLWNLTVKGTDVVGYTQRFQELALMCPRMVPEGEDMVESVALRFEYQVMSWQRKTSPRPLIGQDTSRRTHVDARKHTRKGIFALNPLLKRHKYSDTWIAMLAIRVLTYLIQR
ncbi:reverse transcriptase domain-containing protein [Tanacetum coccineum]